MSSGANVTSFRPLEEFDVSLARFASESEEALQTIAPDIRRKLEVLAQRLDRCAQEVEYWQSTYDYADPEEDDTGYIWHRLEQAQSNLQNVSYWQSRVNESYEEYLRRARRFQEVVIEESPKARAFVRQKLSELQNYVALKAGDVSGVTSVGRSGLLAEENLHTHAEIGGSNTAGADYPIATITNMSLPAGFEWLPLDQIDPLELEALSDLEYKKDGLEPKDVATAFQLLKTDILPAIQNHGEQANSDYFWKLDQETGRQGINSLQSVYDAFFRGDAIWVDRYIGRPHFTIGNGRHRISVARQAGWPAVPAKIMQASLPKNW